MLLQIFHCLLSYIKNICFKKGKAGLYDHFVQINAKEYVPVSANHEPINNIMPVAKSPFDMRLSKHLGRAIFKLPKEGKGSSSVDLYKEYFRGDTLCL